MPSSGTHCSCRASCYSRQPAAWAKQHGLVLRAEQGVCLSQTGCPRVYACVCVGSAPGPCCPLGYAVSTGLWQPSFPLMCCSDQAPKQLYGLTDRTLRLPACACNVAGPTRSPGLRCMQPPASLVLPVRVCTGCARVACLVEPVCGGLPVCQPGMGWDEGQNKHGSRHGGSLQIVLTGILRREFCATQWLGVL